jgi:CubicO group peptidase (beta-lactamase class C family)
MQRLATCAVLLAACAAAPAPERVAQPSGGGAPAAPRAAQEPAQDLTELLAAARLEHGLPAVAAMVLDGRGVLAQGAVGLRRADRDVPVTVDDRWHLGSCSKAMTATLAALLVARGDLAWSTTVGEVFGDVDLDPGWAPVTLADLLTHTSGAPAQLDQDGLWGRLWSWEGTPQAARRELLATLLAHPPEAPPGERFLYSNGGYTLAGAMLETVAGVPFEELFARDLCAPLGMASAGFGAPGTPGEVLQPFGHVLRDGALAPVELGRGDDNPPAISPAGRAHAALRDWGRFAALHLAGARGEPLAPPFGALPFATLHRPRLASYAMGWVVSAPDWCRGPLLWHNGSNTMWYCEVGLFPEEDLAVLVATNTAHGTAREASAGILRALHDRFAERSPKGQGETR